MNSELKKKKSKINYKEKLFTKITFNKIIEVFITYKFLLIIPLLLLFFFYRPQPEGIIPNLIDKLKFLLQLLIWPSLGVITGGILLAIFKNKGQLIIDDNQAFIEYCAKSNGAIFFGSIGSGKTALLAMLAHELPSENKYATFPCQLPWAEKAQFDFAVAPSQRLGVREDIFIDEGNLIFKGNIVHQVRERQRFTMHFTALSRQQGTRIFATYQRLGQSPIEAREVVTGMMNVSLLQKTAEGIYVNCEMWKGVAWTNSKTEEGFIVFVAKKYLDTYNSYWLKSLKYLRPKQGYI